MKSDLVDRPREMITRGWHDIICRCCMRTYARMKECRGFRCVHCKSWNHGDL
jgi:hypothetical protein